MAPVNNRAQVWLPLHHKKQRSTIYWIAPAYSYDNHIINTNNNMCLRSIRYIRIDKEKKNCVLSLFNPSICKLFSRFFNVSFGKWLWFNSRNVANNNLIFFDLTKTPTITSEGETTTIVAHTYTHCMCTHVHNWIMFFFFT